MKNPSAFCQKIRNTSLWDFFPLMLEMKKQAVYDLNAGFSMERQSTIYTAI